MGSGFTGVPLNDFPFSPLTEVIVGIAVVMSKICRVQSWIDPHLVWSEREQRH